MKGTLPFGERAAGFTLVEVLVALAVLGMAALLLLQALQLSGRLVQRQDAEAAALDQVASAQRAIRSVVERLRPLTRTDSARAIVEARGSADAFAMIAPPPDGAGPGMLQRYRLTRTAAGDLVLYTAGLRRQGLDLTGEDPIGWTPQPLLRGVRRLSLSYFGPTATSREPLWQARWWDRSQLPDLVRIRLEFAAGDRRVWPDLVIRPRAVGDRTCRIDPIMGGCRGDER